ncbi:hypothetical protein WA158_007305 [Blastocystis sp. Blastoise]
MRYSYLICLVLFVSSAFAEYYRCSYTATGSDSFPLSANYNLSPLRSTSEWKVLDSQYSSEVNRNFTYVFNICGTVKNVPKDGSVNGTTCDKYKGLTKLYAAYQVANNHALCLSLHDGEAGHWGLLDTTDPSVGITYSYTGGDDYGCGGVKRAFELDLYCHDSSYNLPDKNPIVETHGCYYVLTTNSVYGCPSECGIGDRKLCGGNGVCKFDKDTRSPHCYCYSGYWGSSCMNEGEEQAEGFTETTWALVVVFCFLVLTELGVLCMWKRVSGLRLDPAAYKNMMIDDVAV